MLKWYETIIHPSSSHWTLEWARVDLKEVAQTSVHPSVWTVSDHFGQPASCFRKTDAPRVRWTVPIMSKFKFAFLSWLTNKIFLSSEGRWLKYGLQYVLSGKCKMHAIQAAIHDWVAISASLLKINCMAALQSLIVIWRAYVTGAGSGISLNSLPKYEVRWNIWYLAWS